MIFIFADMTLGGATVAAFLDDTHHQYPRHVTSCRYWKLSYKINIKNCFHCCLFSNI